MLMMNVSQRPGASSLDGKWGFIPDPYEIGFYTYHRVPSKRGYFMNDKVQKSTDLIEYDFSKSWQLKVPGDWSTQRRELWLYEGSAWYGREFNVKLRPGKRYFIEFGAISYRGRIWVNGQKVGEHTGAYTPVQVEVTAQLKDGKNFVAVLVDNLRSKDRVPAEATDWWNYGGLTRPVVLVEEPQTFIRAWSVGLDGLNTRRLKGWVQLDGPPRGVPVTLRIPGLGIEQTLKANAQGRAVFSLDAKPVLWAPGKPKLYKVEIQAGDAKAVDEIGFRTLQVKGQNILVNGKSVFLRGISLHEEAAGKGAGRAHSLAHAKKLMDWVQALGCNFVRLAHYPHNETMVREAERRGLLVWEEIPVYWAIAWTNKATLEDARTQLRKMIERDRNRAATILWAVGNETPLSPQRLKFMSTLVKDAKRLDPTRLVTAALEHHGVGPKRKSHMIDDPLGQHLDVIGLNQYLGWYDRFPGQFGHVTWKTKYNKPIVVSEFGADALKGKRGSKLDRWTEDYQAAVYVEQLAMLSKIKQLRGLTPWILKDFRSPRRPLPGIQDFYNRKGLMTITGEKKLAYKVLRDWYLKKAQEAPKGETRK